MKIKNVINKNREFSSYVIWGFLAAIINIFLFRLLTLIGIEYRIANIITLIVVRVFSYLTNKFFVFKTGTENLTGLLKEMGSFFLARLITFFMDYFGVILLVEVMRIDSLISKIITALIVIICNYVFSKFFVFKKLEEPR